MNNKGSIGDLILLIAFGFMAIMILGGLYYGFHTAFGEINKMDFKVSSGTNFSDITSLTIKRVDTASRDLNLIAVVIIFGMIFSIFVSNALTKAHPAFFIVYIFLTLIGIIASVYVSNAYETLLTSGNVLSSALQNFGAMHYILMHLPIWVTIISFMGGIFLFIGVIVDREQGGSIPIWKEY